MTVAEAAAVIGDGALISGGQRIERNIGSEIVEVCVERNLRVVVIHFAIRKSRMSHRKIKNARVTVGLARRWLREIAVARPIDLQVYHRMLYQKLSQRDFAVE